MGIRTIMANPKGNQGMTLYGTRNDDTTVTLPDIGFDFLYNGSLIRTIYSNGNSWIGIGSSSEHIKINRRDTSYNNLYYSREEENGYKLFRVRFEGNAVYNSWGSNNLVWEVSFYETGVIQLVIEKTPNTAADSFVNPGIGTQSITFETGKSYVFISDSKDGKNYKIFEGSYFPDKNRFLILDEEGIKNFQVVEGVSKWVKVADLPITEEVLLDYGNDFLPSSLEGIVGDTPKVYYYTDNLDVVERPEEYRFKVGLITTSLPKVIEQREDFFIPDGKLISKIIAEVSTDIINSSGVATKTNGKVRLTFSVDEGATYLTFDVNLLDYKVVDISNHLEFLNEGINPENLNVINYDRLNELIESNRKIRFAYILEKPTLSDVCKIKRLKIFYS
ncbi:hypothetical protein NE686_03740 [Tissierella carlieri]|uniref:Uncharacterized protein n=1 Tax=Tissierella carlieri TaxID=689904 RepID=A0ABT1S6S5_9FIRM|nr:hypothetical protein [Tissierella carlieri]MCQ4922182.1 hypothetical protein [Tissierella carlieri]